MIAQNWQIDDVCAEIALLRAKFVAKDKGARGGTVGNKWGKALARTLLAEIPSSSKIRNDILEGARRAASELSRRKA